MHRPAMSNTNTPRREKGRASADIVARATAGSSPARVSGGFCASRKTPSRCPGSGWWEAGCFRLGNNFAVGGLRVRLRVRVAQYMSSPAGAPVEATPLTGKPPLVRQLTTEDVKESAQKHKSTAGARIYIGMEIYLFFSLVIPLVICCCMCCCLAAVASRESVQRS